MPIKRERYSLLCFRFLLRNLLEKNTRVELASNTLKELILVILVNTMILPIKRKRLEAILLLIIIDRLLYSIIKIIIYIKLVFPVNIML